MYTFIVSAYFLLCKRFHKSFLSSYCFIYQKYVKNRLDNNHPNRFPGNFSVIVTAHRLPNRPDQLRYQIEYQLSGHITLASLVPQLFLNKKHASGRDA